MTGLFRGVFRKNKLLDLNGEHLILDFVGTSIFFCTNGLGPHKDLLHKPSNNTSCNCGTSKICCNALRHLRQLTDFKDHSHRLLGQVNHGNSLVHDRRQVDDIVVILHATKSRHPTIT